MWIPHREGAPLRGARRGFPPNDLCIHFQLGHCQRSRIRNWHSFSIQLFHLHILALSPHGSEPGIKLRVPEPLRCSSFFFSWMIQWSTRETWQAFTGMRKPTPVVVCLHHVGGRRHFRLGVSSFAGHCCQHLGWAGDPTEEEVASAIKNGVHRGNCQSDKQALQIFLGRLQLDDAGVVVYNGTKLHVHVQQPSCEKSFFFWMCTERHTCHLDKHGRRYMYCMSGNFRQEFNFVAFVKAIFWLN